MLATAAGHDPAQIAGLLELVGLAPRADDRVRRYSFGMKQRLGIAAALLGDPRLLILDEPINGLDPAGVHEMRGLIGRLAGGERTVLVSSHVLAELEQVCDWLIVIDGGRLVFQGPAAELLDRSGATLVVAPEHPALFGVAAWGSLGMALAIFVRSIPVALGIGIVWSGPFEHLLEDAWNAAGQWFPGLLLEALAAGRTADISSARALTLVAVYVAVAVSAAAIVFARRDVTA